MVAGEALDVMRRWLVFALSTFQRQQEDSASIDMMQAAIPAVLLTWSYSSPATIGDRQAETRQRLVSILAVL
jgi:hypothetical protein